MDSYIYMGGAVGNVAGDKFYPIISKFDKDLKLQWSYSYLSCTSSSDTVSFAVDMMYADNMNDKLYGLMVPRDPSGDLRAHHGYRLIVTKGNYNSDIADPLGTCNGNSGGDCC
jgi:hypothetical protein